MNAAVSATSIQCSSEPSPMSAQCVYSSSRAALQSRGYCSGMMCCARDAAYTSCSRQPQTQCLSPCTHLSLRRHVCYRLHHCLHVRQQCTVTAELARTGTGRRGGDPRRAREQRRSVQRSHADRFYHNASTGISRHPNSVTVQLSVAQSPVNLNVSIAISRWHVDPRMIVCDLCKP
jgi:hypothetical protein